MCSYSYKKESKKRNTASEFYLSNYRYRYSRIRVLSECSRSRRTSMSCGGSFARETRP